MVALSKPLTAKAIVAAAVICTVHIAVTFGFGDIEAPFLLHSNN
jgi:hypothetical protein